MQLIVLGMHRSGTSVLARILNLMGAYMGPEGMSTGANAENPKGFWERRDVRQLNDAALHSLGCDWNRVADLDLERMSGDMAEAFDKVAGRILLEMDAHRPWFLKEPRLCLLLPLWRRHTEVPVAVHIHRDPVEVASSLHRRNAMPMEVGLELWEYYVRSAAESSRGMPSVNVLHAQLMSDPEGAANRLYDDLAYLGAQGLRRASRRELAAFVERGLYRERSGRADLEDYSHCRQALIYRDLVAGKPSLLNTPQPRDWPALREYESSLPLPKRPDPRNVLASRYDAHTLQGRIKSGSREIRALREEVEALKARLNALTRSGYGK